MIRPLLLESSSIIALDTFPLVLITIPIIHVTFVLSVNVYTNTRKMHTHINKTYLICVNFTLGYHLRDFNVVEKLLQQLLTSCKKMRNMLKM